MDGTRCLPFLWVDLTDTPSRIATLRIRSGGRPITFAICSSVFEARASSITRRSCLNDQDFDILLEPILQHKAAKRRSPDGFAGVGPDLGVSGIEIHSQAAGSRK